MKFRVGILAILLLLAPAADGAVTVYRATCATTSTLAVAAPPRAIELRVVNTGATAIFIGPATVTTANGFEILSDVAHNVVLLKGEPLHCIVAAGTETIQALLVPKH